MSPPNIAAVVLAAGKSSRFGSDKRRYQLGGIALLQQSLSKPLLNGLQTLLVLKPSDQDIIDELLGPWRDHYLLQLCFAPLAEKGMAHSLAAAASQAKAGDYDGLLVLLADMPAIDRETLKILTDSFQPDRICVPRYRGQIGHPVLFPQSWFAALMALEGDKGARTILNNNPEQIYYVEADDPGILQDLDQPPDA